MHELIKECDSRAEIVATLVARFGISRSQAYRYLRKAGNNGAQTAVPNPEVPLTVTLPPDVTQELRQYASCMGITLNQLVAQVLVAHFHGNDCHQSGDGRRQLSPREHEVMNWLKQGKTSADIALILGISERTVNFHVHNIMHKLDVVNRSQALVQASRLGLIDLT
jgi:DNA-binding CsgD family transcriptional regulator